MDGSELAVVKAIVFEVVSDAPAAQSGLPIDEANGPCAWKPAR
jgi:hypothetical protein